VKTVAISYKYHQLVLLNTLIFLFLAIPYHIFPQYVVAVAGISNLGFVATAGPYDGLVTGFAQDSQGNIYASTLGSGVFVLGVSSSSWVPVTTQGLTDLSITSILIDSSDDIFVGTKEINGGVFELVPNATTWQNVNYNLPKNWTTRAPFINCMGLDSNQNVWVGTQGSDAWHLAPGATQWISAGIIANNSFARMVRGLAFTPTGKVFAATQLGVYQNTVTGNTWTATSMTEATFSIAVDSSGIIYAGNGFTGGGIYRSVDNGVTWTNNALAGMSIESITTIGTTVFVAADPPTYRGQIYVSRDQGITYKQATTNLSTVTRVWALAVTARGVWLGANGAFLSPNLGGTWLLIYAGLKVRQSVTALAFDNSGNLYAGTYGDGVWRNLMGWTKINSGLQQLNISSLTVNTAGDVIAGAADPLSNGYNQTPAARIAHTYRLPVNSTTWSVSNINVFGIHRVYTASNGDIFAGARWSGIYVSSDGGNTFANQATNLAYAGVIFSFAEDPQHNLYAGAEVGFDSNQSRVDAMYMSADGGQTWNKNLPLGLPATGDDFVSIVDQAGELMYLSRGKGVFVLVGNTWQNYTTGLLIPNDTGIDPYDIAMSPSGILFLGARTGLYISTDNGRTWSSINLGKVSCVYALRFDSRGYLYVGTCGDGIYKSQTPIQ
jgi:hypothetical protein